MNIAYHLPEPDTRFAGKFIYLGYQNAFNDLGHQFYPFLPTDRLEDFLKEKKPDIFITSINDQNLKQLDLGILSRYRKHNGMKMLSWVTYWNALDQQYVDNVSLNLKDDPQKVKQLKEGLLGDAFFIQTEQDDPRMRGFREATGQEFETVLLAADKLKHYPDYTAQFDADISFIGTNMREKRAYFNERLFPLAKKYTLCLYGQNWTLSDRFLNMAKSVAKKINFSPLANLKTASITPDDERKIYSSSKICVNIHTDNQIAFGSDINERFFKILACESFEVTDYVRSMSRYFSEDEIAYARTTQEWFEKIAYYMDFPDRRKRLAKKGRKKVLKEHTYHNRAKQLIQLAKKRGL